MRGFVKVNVGTLLSKQKILDLVWPFGYGDDINVVESYVSYLRRKIGTGRTPLLQTLRGIGYVLRETH